MKAFFLITYDIVDDRRRTKVQKILEGCGTRVQYSVFECWLTVTEWKNLQKRLVAEIEPREDSIRHYLLCQECVPKVYVSGKGNQPKRTSEPWIV